MMNLEEEIQLYLEYRHTPEDHPVFRERMKALLTIALAKQSFREYIPISSTPFIGALNFLSVMIHPEQPTKTVIANRERLFRALIFAFLFDQDGEDQERKETTDGKRYVGNGGKHAANRDFGRDDVNFIVNKYQLNKLDWEKVDATINKANKKISKMLYAYHSFDRFGQYLKQPDKSKELGIGRFLAETAIAYPQIGFDSDEFRMLLESEGISSSDKVATDSIIETPKKYWKQSKPVLHLLEGYLKSHILELPFEYRSLKFSIYNPDWVERAIHLSQNALARHLLDRDMVALGAPKLSKIDLKLDDTIFFDSQKKPFFSSFT